jgi:hypothetical protein
MECKDMNWTRMAQKCAKWNALAWAVLKLQVLLPNDKLNKTTKMPYFLSLFPQTARQNQNDKTQTLLYIYIYIRVQGLPLVNKKTWFALSFNYTSGLETILVPQNHTAGHWQEGNWRGKIIFFNYTQWKYPYFGLCLSTFALRILGPSRVPIWFKHWLAALEVKAFSHS